jgi:hypothetical protein
MNATDHPMVKAVSGAAPVQPRDVRHAGGSWVARVVLALWLALVFILGAAGAFVRPAGQVPYPIALGVAAPLLVFVVAFWLSGTFRAYVLAIDLPLVTAVQAWRFAGFGFLALYAYDVLPPLFAWPAGLGDMAIGLTAPWVALALARRGGFATDPLFVAWNLFGMLDLVVAVGLGALSSSLAAGVAGEMTTAPMARLPLVLIPAFLVPLFLMLHLAALFQARRRASSGRSGARA